MHEKAKYIQYNCVMLAYNRVMLAYNRIILAYNRVRLAYSCVMLAHNYIGSSTSAVLRQIKEIFPTTNIRIHIGAMYYLL